jgi:endonuclease-8
VPEGDTIWRTARTLERAIGGRVVTRFETVLVKLARVDDDTPVAGRTVESVKSEGKWLVMRFSGGLILLTHMLMSGSWHIYRPGERWQRPKGDMRIVIETAEWIAVAFRVPVAEFHTEESLARRDTFRALGPRILEDSFDATRAIASGARNGNRVGAHEATTAGGHRQRLQERSVFRRGSESLSPGEIADR